MFVLIVGSGRVGSTVAKRMIIAGHDVSVLDESPEAHARLDHGLDQSWEELGGRFTVGTALEVDALIEAGIEQADVVICSTDGDNTNIDPYRAEWYREQGLETVCPTQSAIEMLTDGALSKNGNGGDPLMEETR
jgi:trk/ktr system potassium uptake protein